MITADYFLMGLLIGMLVAIVIAWLRELHSRGRDELKVQPQVRKVRFDIETDYRRKR